VPHGGGRRREGGRHGVDSQTAGSGGGLVNRGGRWGAADAVVSGGVWERVVEKRRAATGR
jgi:hypothetical protein